MRIELPAPTDYKNWVTLFRTIWLLHSGELWGKAGKLVADFTAVLLIILCLTGWAYWLLPTYIRRKKWRGKRTDTAAQWLKRSFNWHNHIGRTTLVLTLLIALTGWCLRPPLMIPLVLHQTAALPGSTLDSPNPWHDRLRMLRYDAAQGDWLLSTSEGIFSLPDFQSTPKRLPHTPPVSVMGLNVWQQDAQGRWLLGSFSGLYVWDRNTGHAFDFFTHEPAPEKAGPPFGQRAVSGYSNHFATSPFAVDYYEGTSSIPQPDALRTLPMSLWNVALEAHSGRLFIGTYATYIFVFFAGGALLWCLWSGWKVRKRKKAA